MKEKGVGTLLLAVLGAVLLLECTSGGLRAELVPKMGYVDVQRVFQNYQKTKDVMTSLTVGFEEKWAAVTEKRKLLEEKRRAIEEKLSQTEEKGNQIEKKGKELAELEEELKLQGPLLAPSVQEEKLAQIQLLSQDIQRLEKERQNLDRERRTEQTQLRALEEEVRSLSDSLQAEKQKEEFRYSEEISADIRSTIKGIAEKGGYRLVFDKDALLYATPEVEFDLTEEVLSRLNQNYRSGQ